MRDLAHAPLLTAEQFYRLPDPEDGGKMELVRGEVVVHMPVGRPHARTVARLVRYLDGFVDEFALGEMHAALGHRLETGPDTVRVPDVSFTSRERLASEPEAGFLRIAPDLAVEVKSPANTEPELVRKAGEYLVAGARRVWIVRPEQRTVTVYHDDGIVRMLDAASTLTSDDTSFSVEGFTLPLEQLFR